MEREPPASRWLRNAAAILGGVMGQGALSQMAQMGLVSASARTSLKNSRPPNLKPISWDDIMYDSGSIRVPWRISSKLQRRRGARPAVFHGPSGSGNRAQQLQGSRHFAAQDNYRATAPESAM